LEKTLSKQIISSTNDLYVSIVDNFGNAARLIEAIDRANGALINNTDVTRGIP
jgi:hypothetical protein